MTTSRAVREQRDDQVISSAWSSKPIKVYQLKGQMVRFINLQVCFVWPQVSFQLKSTTDRSLSNLISAGHRREL